jgi:hypothetical protein
VKLKPQALTVFDEGISVPAEFVDEYFSASGAKDKPVQIGVTCHSPHACGGGAETITVNRRSESAFDFFEVYGLVGKAAECRFGVGRAGYGQGDGLGVHFSAIRAFEPARDVRGGPPVRPEKPPNGERRAGNQD